jgi:hypothetical protein
VDPVPDPLLFFSGSAGNRKRASGSVASNCDHRGGPIITNNVFYSSFQNKDGSQDRSLRIVMGYGLHGWSLIPTRGNSSPLHSVQHVLGLNQPPIRRVKVAICQRNSGRGVKLATRLHLVPKSTMVEPYLHSPQTSS